MFVRVGRSEKQIKRGGIRARRVSDLDVQVGRILSGLVKFARLQSANIRVGGRQRVSQPVQDVAGS